MKSRQYVFNILAALAAGLTITLAVLVRQAETAGLGEGDLASVLAGGALVTGALALLAWRNHAGHQAERRHQQVIGEIRALRLELRRVEEWYGGRKQRLDHPVKD